MPIKLVAKVFISSVVSSVMIEELTATLPLNAVGRESQNELE
jgi:hypothetical protein